MCFRPAQISMKTCPQCGASNKPIATVCAQCGAALEVMRVDMDADQAALDAANTTVPFNAPGAPAAPAVPGMSAVPMPSTPSAPTAPAAPGAPSAPKPPQA